MENENQVSVEEKKGLSIASMVLGIVGLFLFAVPCGVLAIIFSIFGRRNGGKGFATAGLILGIIDAAFGIFSIIVAMTAISSIML